MQVVFGVSALCLFVPVMYQSAVKPEAAEGEEEAPAAGLSFEGQVQLLAFCAFEVMVGIFWPSMMTMRSAYVPEEIRSTIINFFRIPLNLFVCAVLYNVRVEGYGLGLGQASLPGSRGLGSRRGIPF